MSASATYDPTLARVELAASTWGATVTYVTVERYDTPTLTNPQIVRGGSHIPMVTGQVLALDDYEYSPGVLNTYKVRAYNASDVEVPTYTYTATITPAHTLTWLKSITRPFLNRTVTVTGWGDVVRPSRGAVFEVLGRRLPVAVTEVRGSRRLDLTLRAADAAEVDALVLFASFGDVVLFQPPLDCPVPDPGYFLIGDLAEIRTPRHDSTARYFALPLTEVAAPDAAVVGYTATYGGIASAFATYGALAAAFTDYLDLSEYVSAPADEVVG